jgi:hypothetical protein
MIKRFIYWIKQIYHFVSDEYDLCDYPDDETINEQLDL